MIFIDFETRSTCDLIKAGADRYARHESTQVLCMAYALGSSAVRLTVPGRNRKCPITGAITAGQLVSAYNVGFERAIWRQIMVKQYGWPDIKDEQWRCSAAKGATHALPRALKYIALAMNLSAQKDDEGYATMLKLCRPRKPTKNDPSEWSGTHDDFQKLYAYCKDDVKAERALSQRIRDLSPKELEIWQLDQKMNDRGIMVDIDFVQKAIEISTAYKEELKAEFTKLTDIEIKKAVPQKAFKSWINNNKMFATDVTKQTILDLLKDESLTPNQRRVLTIKQELNKTSTAKYERILMAVCSDRRVRGLLRYHGASTGRWTGNLVQPQNLPRNTLKNPIIQLKDIMTGEMPKDLMSTLSAMIRLSFIASPGKTMYGGDYSAIEARALLWLAGDEKALNLYREGLDIYKDLASTIYLTTYDKVDKDQRDMGKRGILGCGFGMGAKRFKDACKEVADLEISIELAQKVIDIYRDKYRLVVQLWNDQENAAIQAVETKKPVTCGKVLWAVHDHFLYCKLPSGRCLAYYRPQMQTVKTPWGQDKLAVTFFGINSATKQWERQSTYGGKIVENITQAVARDLMAEAMLRVEAAGYEMLLTIHDELLAEKTKGSVKEFEALMVELPDWAEGLPIEAEGWSGERYLK